MRMLQLLRKLRKLSAETLCQFKGREKAEQHQLELWSLHFIPPGYDLVLVACNLKAFTILPEADDGHICQPLLANGLLHRLRHDCPDWMLMLPQQFCFRKLWSVCPLATLAVAKRIRSLGI
jgi:hypothetical protein